MDKITVIIPVFNESAVIEDTIRDLKPYVEKNDWEIIVVNDGSTDGTREILRKIKGINVIDHPYNKGYGSALKTGIKHAHSELVAFYDGDGQHNPKDIETLLNNFSNFDMIIGQRGKDSHQQWIRKPGKWLLSRVANYLTGKKIPDLNSGLRIVKHSIISKLLHILPEGFSFSSTSTIAFMNLGFSVGFYPIKDNKRIGKSTVKQLRHGTNTLLLILRLIVLFNPLKIFISVSIYLFIIGTIYEIFYGIIFYSEGVKLIPGALFLMITSILIFFFGLVVDQISEMRKHMYFK